MYKQTLQNGKKPLPSSNSTFIRTTTSFLYLMYISLLVHLFVYKYQILLKKIWPKDITKL